MKNYFSNKKSVLFLLFCFVFCGIMPVAEPIFGSAPAGRTGRAISSSERSAYEDRKALEVYEKRNAGVDSGIQGDVEPSHNNAALLYYQAFILLPDADGAMKTKIYDVYGGAKPDTQIRKFLGKCVPALELFKIASLMPQCTWAVWPEDQNCQVLLGRKLSDLSYIISVDASTLAADGHYLAALEQCLTLRRIAMHLCDDPELQLFSMSCDLKALRTIRRILGEMPLNANILMWLEGQFALIQVTPSTLERALQDNLKAKLDMVQSYSIASLRGMLLKRTADEQAKQDIQDLPDEQIRDQAVKTVQGLFGSIFAILGSRRSAEQKHAEIQKVTNYTVKPDVYELLNTIDKELGQETVSLIMGTGIEMTEEQKLSQMQEMMDRFEQPQTIELLKKFSHAVGEEIDFGFLVNSAMTDKQRLAQMQKVIPEINEAFVVEISTFGFSWDSIDGLFKSQVKHTAQVNSIRAAIKIYLIMVKTGQLPEELPDYLAKDPYTGRDFLYEITDDRFVLGCQSDIFEKGKERFTFYVQKKSN